MCSHEIGNFENFDAKSRSVIRFVDCPDTNANELNSLNYKAFCSIRIFLSVREMKTSSIMWVQLRNSLKPPRYNIALMYTWGFRGPNDAERHWPLSQLYIWSLQKFLTGIFCCAGKNVQLSTSFVFFFWWAGILLIFYFILCAETTISLCVRSILNDDMSFITNNYKKISKLSKS